MNKIKYRAALLAAIAAMLGQASVAAESTTLFSGGDLDHFTAVGDANWTLADGAVGADAGKGFLVTKQGFGDFHLIAEFWTSPDANSGIFIRCADPAKITPESCYEVNVFDQRPDPTYRTGSIVHVAPPLAHIDAGGRWNRFDITVKGKHIVIKLNDVLMVDIEDETHAAGAIALQYGGGVVRFRKVEIEGL